MFSRFSSATHTFSFSCSSLEGEQLVHELHHLSPKSPSLHPGDVDWNSILLLPRLQPCPQLPPSSIGTERPCPTAVHSSRKPHSAGPGTPRQRLYLHSQEGSLLGLRSELEGAESLVCFSPQTKRMKVKDHHSFISLQAFSLPSAWKMATCRVFTQVCGKLCSLFYFCS